MKRARYDENNLVPHLVWEARKGLPYWNIKTKKVDMKEECGEIMGEGWKMVRQMSAIYQALEGEPSKCSEYRTAVSRSMWWLSQKPLWALGLSHGQQTKKREGWCSVHFIFRKKKKYHKEVFHCVRLATARVLSGPDGNGMGWNKLRWSGASQSHRVGWSSG